MKPFSSEVKICLKRRGVSLVEVLIGLILLVVACLATLQYFAYGLGGVGTSGNRRAALERARQRLEQLLEANVDNIKPPTDGNTYWLRCAGDPCAWTVVNAAPNPPQTILVDELAAQPIETTVRWVDDPTVTPGIPDTLELGVKVWFTQDFGTDDNFSRVHIRTLRTP